ncbi:MAG: ABC transporter substrate-binding protein [Candidatus Auribacterota bacterium]|nr:ABC transporter substrate-binding protein [Candidatus Auribacterota bacterium]
MKRIMVIGLGLILGLGLLVPAGVAGEELEEYKVGAVFAITGPASWLGEPERNTALMIEEEIDKAGGINGHPLKLIIEDTVGDATRTVNAVKKLINSDQVCAIIGPSRSGCTLAVVPIMQEARVPLISCAAAESIVLGKDGTQNKWIFKTPQKDSHAAEKIFEDMKSKGISRIAILSGTTGFGAQGRKQLIKLAPAWGMEIVADETYSPKDSDMTVQLTKMKGNNPQAIVNWSIVPAQAIVCKNMQQLGMDIPLYQSHGFGNIKYVEAAGEAAEGTLFPCGRLLVVDYLPEDNPQKKLLAAYKKDYEDRFKEKVSTFGGHAYDSLRLVIEALKAVGPDRAKIREYLENKKDYVGTGGIFVFSPEDHNGLTREAFEMITVKDGGFALPKK